MFYVQPVAGRNEKYSCLSCEQHRNGSLTDDEYAVHIEWKERAQNEKEKDKERAKKEPHMHVCAFDLEQVLSTPNTSTSTILYMQKLNVYNLSVYSLGTGSGSCILWN